MKWTRVKHRSVGMVHFSTSNMIEIQVGNQDIMIDTYDFASLLDCIRQIDAIEREYESPK